MDRPRIRFPSSPSARRHYLALSLDARVRTIASTTRAPVPHVIVEILEHMRSKPGLSTDEVDAAIALLHARRR